jgi:hypothetical protein
MDSVLPHPIKRNKENSRNINNFGVVGRSLDDAVIEFLDIIHRPVIYLLSDNVQKPSNCINIPPSLHFMMVSIILKWNPEVLLVGDCGVCGVIK